MGLNLGAEPPLKLSREASSSSSPPAGGRSHLTAGASAVCVFARRVTSDFIFSGNITDS